MAARGSPKVSSAPSSSGFGIRNYFQRSPSPRNRSANLRADKTKASSSPKRNQRLMQRSAVFECCAQSVGTVASVLFAVINTSGHYDELARDNTVTRQAKILYVSLLESVQKERGEWQGFSSSSSNNNGSEDTDGLSPRDLLASSISVKSTTAQLGVLNELLEVSFRNLMGPLVPLELYTHHKKLLLRESLAVPAALPTLFAIRSILDRLEQEVRHCLLRLLTLWDLIALVNGESQPLHKMITEKHHHVFSESSEFESMTARKSERQDTVAIDLLQIMVLYRDILFNDIEFILTKQEMKIDSKLIEDVRIRSWSPDVGAVTLSDEDDRFSSDGDISSSDNSDENQAFHDDLAWGPSTALEPSARRSRTLSSMSSTFQEYYDDDGDGEWFSPSPTHYNLRRDRRLQRSHTVASPPISGGAGPLVPVPMIPSSSDGIPPPDTLIRIPRQFEHDPIGSEHRRSRSISQASSSTRSSTQNIKSRTKQRSSSSITANSRIDQRRQENRWQDTTSSESRSPQHPSRSTLRRKSAKRLKDNVLGRRRRATKDTVQFDGERLQDKCVPKPTKPSFLSQAAANLAIPFMAATLCVIATMATLTIHEMRKASRN